MKRLAAIALMVGLGTGATAQPDRMRVTSANNVRVRGAPSLDAAIVGSLPLAADLVELEVTADAQWVRVRTAKAIEGWVSAPLTRPVPPGGRDRVLTEIAAVRSRGHYGFDAAVELIALVSDLETRASEPEARARLALYRLMALKDAASRDFSYSSTHGAWFKQRPSLFIYNEPGGSWMLHPDALIAEHNRHRGTAAAQEIAALAVENGLPGECEGDVPCYVGRWNRVEGWYLREYPAGAMAGAIMDRLLGISLHWRAYQKNPSLFERATHCVPLTKPLEEMRSVVAAAKPRANDRELQADVLRSLDLLAAGCKTEPAA